MLEITEVLLDFGLLILIWMVQLIIYPSFLYYSPKDLISWHHTYTGRIAVLVIPLMFGQLGVSAYQMYENFEILRLIKFILILFVWIFTFAYFAPTHKKISAGITSQNLLKQLVHFNWWRTIAWTLVSLISIIHLIQHTS